MGVTCSIKGLGGLLGDLIHQVVDVRAPLSRADGVYKADLQVSQCTVSQHAMSQHTMIRQQAARSSDTCITPTHTPLLKGFF